MATWNINPTSGNDSTGNGTTLPWKTLQKAHDMASSGDTVILKAGHHYLTASSTVSLTKSLTFSGETGRHEDSIIDGDVAGYSLSALFGASSISFSLSGISYRNMLSGTNGSHGVLGWTQYSSQASCTLDVSNASFFEAAIYNGDNPEYAHFVYVSQSIGNTINLDKCLFVDKTHTGVIPFYGFFPSLALDISNSIFVVSNIRSNGFFYVVVPTGVWSIRNSHFEHSGASCPLFASSPAVTTFNNNNLVGDWSGVLSGVGNVAADGKFVDPDNYNYHIGRGSPLFSAGGFL